MVGTYQTFNELQVVWGIIGCFLEESERVLQLECRSDISSDIMRWAQKCTSAVSIQRDWNTILLHFVHQISGEYWHLFP